MIRKLRVKFVFTNMLIVSIVLIMAFVFIYFSTANNLRSDSISAMKEISKIKTSEAFSVYGRFFMNTDNEYSYLSTFTVDTNDISMKYQINGFEVDAININEQQNDYINTLIRTVYSAGISEGIIDEYNLRYYSVDTIHGKRIVFLDKEYEDITLKQLVITFIFVGTSALTAFLFISIIISKLIVAPVEKSLKQQMQLVADASHELKTPITVISANTDILMANRDSHINEQMKWLEYIKTEAGRMTELVNNMLFLAKTDENKLVQAKSVINLSDIVNSCILPFESISYENNKNLSINITPNIYIKSNENAIKQLINIIVDNAFKYSDEHGRINVSVLEVQDNAVITVWNSGRPIPPDQLPHVFERFYRVDKSRSRTEGGYGLGLSIAKSIIESLNAKINVRSSEESGTAFTCTFKVYKEHQRN
ncbi:MAG: hypothetical protein CVU97_05420 [Firmicutes bacterium HGW-Firmicutes-21]|nr:MAG: hypothetical protein CVU97_05420 [Firmicutes bacterium HGW-Firmicutes-21]